MALTQPRPIFPLPPPAADVVRSRVCLLDELPETRAAIPPADLEGARQALRVVAVTVAPGPFELAELLPAGALAAVIVDGLVLRCLKTGQRTAAEALGPGDLLHPPDPEDRDGLAVSHRVRRLATFAILDDRFRLCARRWPRLHDTLQDLVAQQLRRSSRSFARLHAPRVEDRLLAVLRDLAERWGRVTPAGIVVDLELTHDLLGQLVGARRPTVSLAVAELERTARLVRRGERSWLIPA